MLWLFSKRREISRCLFRHPYWLSAALCICLSNVSVEETITFKKSLMLLMLMRVVGRQALQGSRSWTVVSGGPEGLSLCLVPWAGPGWQEVPPCRVAKGTAAVWGPRGTSEGAPVSVTAWCELLRSTLVWERHCWLRTWHPFLQLQPYRKGQNPCPAGTVPAPVSQPCRPTAARPSSITGVPASAPTARCRTHHTGTALTALGRNFIVSKDLLIL